jgi:type I restriction enzyme M protein
VLDMENAAATKDLSNDERGIFMVDASKGYMKDGNKNRLREQDIHKIVDVFNKQTEVPKYSRFVSLTEISDPKNDFNLNIPRYIDSQETEDIQDIDAHLQGGIPDADIEALSGYWDVCPGLKNDLFEPADRPNYSRLKITKDAIKPAIFNQPEFVLFRKEMDHLFESWKMRNTLFLKGLDKGIKPKQTIRDISEDVLKTYTDKNLMDKYDVYQHLMNYWNETMQDDCYLIAVDGWKAEPYRITVKNKDGKETDKGWNCDLVPKSLVIDRYFHVEAQGIATLENEKEAIATQIAELEEEHSAEEGYFADFDKVNKASVQKRLNELKSQKEKKEKRGNLFYTAAEPTVEYGSIKAEKKVLEQYLKFSEDLATLTRKIKEAIADLDLKTLRHYKTLTVNDIKQLVVDDKWMTSIERSVKTEMERISQRLTQRIKELAERYETPMPQQTNEVAEMEAKVIAHLQKMGFVWK